MYKSLRSAMVVGIEGAIIEVELHASGGLPGITIVGLPDAAVSESKDRARSAIYNSGFEFPLKRITVNLAPANLKKEYAFFDLPIALGVLSVSGQLSESVDPGGYIITGELALDGRLLPLRGMLPIAATARRLGLKLIAPAGNIDEMRIIEGLEYYAFDNLADTVEYITKNKYKPARVREDRGLMTDNEIAHHNMPDMKDIVGQSCARRALEIAAAGGHALMMRGVPGSGKTMLSTCLPGILPDMSFEESLEVSKIYSISGLLKSGRLMEKRAFRSPHHTISEAAMIGGSRIPRPGEVSLAHNGVLFLDEFTEYRAGVLEALRQPLSSGCVTISRAAATYTYPARFMLVAACNPCPCGYSGDPKVACRCAPASLKKYAARFSGPIIDRIDIQIDVRRVDAADIKKAAAKECMPESSAAVAKRVRAARALQLKRFSGQNPSGEFGAVFSNAGMSVELIKKHCAISSEQETTLRDFVERRGLSMRSYYKILKVARTIADLAGSKNIGKEDLLEAIQYRGGSNY